MRGGPLFFKSLPIDFNQFAACRLIDHQDARGWVDAGDDHIMKRRATRFFETRDQRPTLTEVPVEFCPVAPKNVRLEPVSAAIALHSRAANAFKILGIERPLNLARV